MHCLLCKGSDTQRRHCRVSITCHSRRADAAPLPSVSDNSPTLRPAEQQGCRALQPWICAACLQSDDHPCSLLHVRQGAQAFSVCVGPILFAVVLQVCEPCGPAGHWQQVGHISGLASGRILRIVSYPVDIAFAPFSIALKCILLVKQLLLGEH